MIDRFNRAIGPESPAAIMFRSIFASIFSNQALDDVFNQYRERQIQSPLLFSGLVNLQVPVVSGSAASVNTSHQASRISRTASEWESKIGFLGIQPFEWKSDKDYLAATRQTACREVQNQEKLEHGNCPCFGRAKKGSMD